MKLISLNMWGGNVYEPLMQFIKEQSVDTDVFCFQEMVKGIAPKRAFAQVNGWRMNVLQEIENILPEFNVRFEPMQDNCETDPEEDGESQMGVAIFYKKNLRVTEEGAFFIHRAFNAFDGKNFETLGHNAVYIVIKNDHEKPIMILTVHGTAMPGHKRDTPDRIQQSQRIIDFLVKREEEKIVMGDFNLFPDTESIEMIEKSGLRNLIKEFDIKTTRGSLIKKLRPEFGVGEYGWQEYADYTFVSPGIHIESFSVPDEPISDHLPMILKTK